MSLVLIIATRHEKFEAMGVQVQGPSCILFNSFHSNFIPRQKGMILAGFSPRMKDFFLLQIPPNPKLWYFVLQDEWYHISWRIFWGVLKANNSLSFHLVASFCGGKRREQCGDLIWKTQRQGLCWLSPEKWPRNCAVRQDQDIFHCIMLHKIPIIIATSGSIKKFIFHSDGAWGYKMLV